jgi:adenine-specific DNA-methyltransferase
MKFLEILEETLKQDSRFVGEDGRILKTKVYDACMGMDGLLLERLINNKTLKCHFFVEVNGTLVFDKMKFAWVLESREFLPDSYTMFKNKIGLADSKGNLISQQSDVTLVWPYKDCVLEGSQTKEDQKRDEIFYNETLAPDEVNRLLYPKVFTRAKRYTKDGVVEVDEIEDTDNLIIKGNNLLALTSLLKRYEGKVKCIYIDPPYNTGSDSFKYNDSFNHSSWLTFVQNRLSYARKLLQKNGVIFVHCDNHEQAYLKCMLDGIFGRDCFIETITVVNNPRGRDYGGIANMHEFIHVYAKNASQYELYRIKDKSKQFPYEDEIGGYEVRELRNRNTAFNDQNRPNLCYPFYVNPSREIDNGFLEVSIEPKEGFVEVYPAKSMGIQTVWRWSKEKSYENLNVNIVGKAMQEAGRYMIVEKYRDDTQMARSVWWDKEVNSERGTVHLRELFGKKVFSYPKPEELLLRILSISLQKGDIILDFFLGSGTTAAVAHKMGFQYIGVEQMDYINTVTVPRLQKVIDGEQGGISEAVNWQGGGSFVYCELMEQNESIVSALQAADTSEEVQAILNRVTDDGLIIPSVLPDDLRSHMDEFAQMPLEQQKKLVMELIDKNKLYVNLCDMDDEELAVSDADKAFTRSFYRMDERGGM